jgi:hypothetical protein
VVTTTISEIIKGQAPNPQDDFFHPVGADPSWSESYYFYYFDPVQNIGGITRMGFRAHDGWKDHMHIVFLEGRRIVFCYDRQDMPPGDEDLRVGGLSLERLDPFKAWRLTYKGRGQDLADGRVLVTPKRDRPEGWLQAGDVEMEINFRAVHDPIYMVAEAGKHGHFEQPGACEGFIAVNGERRAFSGMGLRDKSWGPRPWTEPEKGEKPPAQLATGAASGLFNMWITSIFNENLGFALVVAKRPNGQIKGGGFLYKDGVYHQTLEATVDTEFEDGSLIQRRHRFSATFENGHSISGVGEIINLGPSKIPQPGGATLVNSGMTRFQLDTGETGLGSSEYWIAVKRD